MTETWDSIDRYVVISSDSHAGADLRDYKAYLPQKWHDDFEAWAGSYESPYDDLIHATAKRNWDNDYRLSEMDADGISAEILIPNTIPPFFESSMLIVVTLPRTREEFERRWAGVQAHNRWVVDFVSKAPLRRRGLVQIFPNDVDAALAEIRWAKETGAFGGVLLAPVPPGHPVPQFFHTRYEPLWALCAELDMPIATHNGVAPDMAHDQPASVTLALLKGTQSVLDMYQDMLVAAVFERHPNLKIVPTETGIAAYYNALQLDHMIASMKAGAANRTMGMFGGPHVESMQLKPSEYVLRQFYYGSSGPAALREVFELRDIVGVDHMMWGTDYPHEEGTTPQSKELIRWAFADVSVEDTRKMLAGNIGRLYGFDLDGLVPTAKRIGPEVAWVHTPYTAEELAQGGNLIPEFVDRPFSGGALLARSREATSHF